MKTDVSDPVERVFAVLGPVLMILVLGATVLLNSSESRPQRTVERHCQYFDVETDNPNAMWCKPAPSVNYSIHSKLLSWSKWLFWKR